MNFSIHQNHLEGFLNAGFWVPALDFGFGVWWGLSIHSYNKFPADADDADPGTTLWEPLI